ncbi:MAG: S8 family peptidase [Proteobacteria bacterium]|nr:S8 family peptidase [Pseudomonadota bacterium]
MLALLLGLPAVVLAQAGPEEGQRFIVKLRATPLTTRAAADEPLNALAARAGAHLLEGRSIAGGLQLMRVSEGGSVPAVLARLRADPEVQYAEVDQRRHALGTPNDPLFSGQWYLQDTEPSGVDALDAWSVATGSAGLVIAELDTGVRFDHPDLRSSTANRLLPGYDMISNVTTGNTGLGRNPDASDPGDWVSEADTKTALFSSCTVGSSSWHGTRVAGILGALSNNDTGIAGLTWSGWVLPVRVLGKCGGYDSDILAGMAWAAGFPVSGVPANPYPARIINMSLGAAGDCPQSYQDLIDQLAGAGVLVVVSAGNEGGPVDAPANCVGVAGVAGLRQVGTKVGFSSLGPEIALSAPAGNCVNSGANQPCLYSIETTTNSGSTVPETNTYTDEYNFNVGTSFSAPIVSGIAGLMLSVNGNLTAGQLIARLQLGAVTPFPAPPGLPACHVPASQTDLQTSECACTTQVCGAGMANAQGAVLQAQRPIAAVALPLHVNAGASVALDASGSAAACGSKVVSYQWTMVEPSGANLIQNPQSVHASIPAPTGSGVYQLELTVTDEAGRVDTAPIIVTSGMANSTAPANAGSTACLAAVKYSVSGSPTSGASGDSGSGSSASGGGSGGGGGALDAATALAVALAALVRAAYASRSAASSHSRCARR